MGITTYSSLVGQLLHLLPVSVIGALDAWSHRVAQRRAAERQRRWLERKAPPVAVPETAYQLRPWRD